MALDQNLEFSGENLTSRKHSNFRYDEKTRNLLIHQLKLDDSEVDSSFDRFTLLARKFLNVPTSFFSVFAQNRSFLKSSVGLNDAQMQEEDFGLELVLNRKNIIQEDASKSEDLKHSSFVKKHGYISFIGVPIFAPDGHELGVFSVADRVPRQWRSEDIALIEEFGQLVMHEIEIRYRNHDVQRRLTQTQHQLDKVLAYADCLVWEAEVDISGEDWDWKFNLHPSGLFKRLFGEAQPPQNVGLWYRFKIPQQEEMNVLCRNSILNGESGYEQEFEVLIESGVLWIKENVTIRKSKQNTFWLVGVATDITPLKELEKELSYARDKAIENARLKSEFLANMSHEIRTPMNGIIGMSNLLDQEPLDPKHRQMNRLVASSAESLLGIIDDVLDFSKIESGKMRIEEVDFNLSNILEQVSTLLSVNAEKKHVSLRCSVDPTLPRNLKGDPTRMRQVVNNILGNAVKFTEKGWVELSLTCKELEKDRVNVRIDVKDTGPGIPVEAQKDLFNPFVQADGSHTRKFGGTGLGLAISKQLIEIMGGSIHCESEPEKGSHFWIEISFAYDSSAKDVAVEAGSIVVPSRSGSSDKSENESNQTSLLDEVSVGSDASDLSGKKHLLLVDDNPTNRLVCRLMLTQLGLVVSIAKNGEEAIEELKQGRFDAVIMDCQMPVMDGYEATRIIRSNTIEGLDSQIPVIALTAHAMNGDRERCIDAGMDEYISKPIRKNNIEEVLTKTGILTAA